MIRMMIKSVFLTTAIVLPVLSGTVFGEDRVVEVKVRADSEDPGMEAFLALDGNPGTFWHSRWHYPTKNLPHEIVVDLG